MAEMQVILNLKLQIADFRDNCSWNFEIGEYGGSKIQIEIFFSYGKISSFRKKLGSLCDWNFDFGVTLKNYP